MRPKMILIAPNEEIYKAGQQVVEEGKFNCEVIIGNLAIGAQLARAAAEEGAEVIISRGGTYLDICQVVENVPCVPIYVTTIDLLEAMHQAADQNRRIGVVGYANTIYDASSLGGYLDYDIVEIPVHNPEELEARLREEAKQGLEVIVGDTISVKVATGIGLKGILISSGKRAIYEALVRAEDVALLRKKDELAKARIETVLNSVAEGILATDHEGRVTHFNPVAVQVLGIDSKRIIGSSIQALLPEYNGSEEILSLFGHQYLISTQQIVYEGSFEAGFIIILKALKDIQEIETMVRKKLHRHGLVAKHTISDVLGESPQIHDVLGKLRKISDSNATVLIIGRTGVGKEMLAQSIHNLSARREGPFVAVNCAAFSETLLESELFGYVEGSFTDARKGGKEGLFELAHRGTIFLDEIGEMSLSVQAKVLRVMQEREVMRLGDNRIMPVDIRIVAATNNDLWEAVQKHRFREDLYYRVNVLSLEIPTLAERKNDIPILAANYLMKNAPLLKIEPHCFEGLKSYDWPGNVRQLHNFIEQLIVFNEGQKIRKEDLDLLLNKLMRQRNSHSPEPAFSRGHLTDESIRAALESFQGNQTAAAEALGIDRTTLWRRLKKIQAI